MKINKQRGFTLIELLVVVAIIGLLSSVVLASLNSAREKARVAKAKMELRQFQSAVEMYYDTNGSYPCPGHWYPGASGDPTSCLASALASYIKFPSTDPWGNYYIWHLHPGTCECTSFVSMGPNKVYDGYQPPPYHCQANGDDLISLISTTCQ
jgi:type II secretion system protein G